jgi:hypothetical protein
MADKKTTVVTQALRDESKKWLRLADGLATVQRAVDGLQLGLLAFHLGDKALLFAPYHQKYNGFATHLSGVLGQGKVECEQMAGALVRMANEYDRTDLEHELDLRSIYTAMDNQPPVPRP